MELQKTSWQESWYENEVSERFFQELARLEKSHVKSGATTGEWVNQMLIEMGMLAQNLLQLEHGEANTAQIKLAYEKALRVSALGAHFAFGLNQAHTAKLRQSTLQTGYAPAQAMSQAVGRATQALERGNQMLKHLENGGGQVKEASADGGSQKPMSQAEIYHASSSTGSGTHSSPETTAQEGSPAKGGQPVREMINSLARRGVSVPEIEVITGQPKRVIEAVLAGY